MMLYSRWLENGDEGIWLLFFTFIFLRVFLAERGLSLVWWAGATLQGCLKSSHCCGSSCHRAWAQWCSGFRNCGPRAPYLQCMGSVALRHVGSSWTKDQTGVPCISRCILNHWTRREAQEPSFCYTQLTLLSSTRAGGTYRASFQISQTFAVPLIFSVFP